MLPFHHISVLTTEVVTGLALCANGHYLDATVGGGGHSQRILEADPSIQITALDQDWQALAAAKANLAEWGDRVQFRRCNFAEYHPGALQFDGIVADLGVSSAQLDSPERGFSFRHPGALDMRMDDRQSLTAAEIVNTWDEQELARIFFAYGEERLSRRIARQIVQQRPFHMTTDLAATIATCVPGRYRQGRIHPATRVFQALRIATNHELVVLEKFLQLAPQWLKPAGRLVVISFHSLEDRIVKHSLRDSPLLTVLTKKPILPQPEELARNSRSRSAKLRIAARLC